MLVSEFQYVLYVHLQGSSSQIYIKTYAFQMYQEPLKRVTSRTAFFLEPMHTGVLGVRIPKAAGGHFLLHSIQFQLNWKSESYEHELGEETIAIHQDWPPRSYS